MMAAGSGKFEKRDLRGLDYGGASGNNINHPSATTEVVI